MNESRHGIKLWLVPAVSFLVLFGFSLLQNIQKAYSSQSSDSMKSIKKDNERYKLGLQMAADQDEGSKIIINLPARTLTAYYEGKEALRFPVAIGAIDHKTPISDREVKQIVWNPWWLPPPSPWAKGAKPTPPGPNNPLGPVKMDMGQAILMHGTNKEWTVGSAASHGCMRLKKADAKKLAWWIQSHFTSKTDEKLLAIYAKNSTSSYYVNVEKKLPVHIQYEVIEKADDKIRLHPDVYGKASSGEETFLKWARQNGLNHKFVNKELIAKKIKEASSGTVSKEVALSDVFPPSISEGRDWFPDPFEKSWNTFSGQTTKNNLSLAGDMIAPDSVVDIQK